MVGAGPALDDLVRRALEDRAIDFGAASNTAPLGKRNRCAANGRNQPAAAP